MSNITNFRIVDLIPTRTRTRGGRPIQFRIERGQ